MKILIVEPNRRPRRAEIPHALGAMQQTVGGYIQAIYPYDDPVALVCDEEGKLKGLDLNRYIPNVDIIAGTFFVCGLGEEDFTNLPDELADKYEKMFYYPQVFLRSPKGIIALNAKGEQEVVSI